MAKKINKLGNSTNITIGKKTYSSYDVPNLKPQNKDIHVVSKSYKPNIQRQSAISVTPKTIIRNQRPTSANAGVMTNVKNKVQNSLNSHDDSGTSTISTAIDSGVVTVKSFKTAQTASPYAVNAVKKTARGTYDVGIKTVKVVRAVDSTVSKIKTGVIPLNSQTFSQLKTMTKSKIMATQPIQRLSTAVTGVKTAVSTARRYGIMVGQGTMKTVSVARGVLNGTVKVHISKQALNGFRNATFKGMRLSGRTVGYVLKTGTTKGLKTGLVGLKRGSKGIATGVIGVGNILEMSEDMGTQAVSLGIKSAHYTGKAIKTAPKFIKHGGKTVRTVVLAPVKTGRTVYRAGKGVAGMARMVRKLGLKDAVRFYRSRAMKAVAKTGGSAVSAIMKVGMKVIAPVLLIVVLVIAVSNMVSAPVSGVGAIFGGAFSIFTDNGDGTGTYTDFDTHEYLQNAIVPLKANFVAQIENERDTNLVDNGGSYHYIRLFTETDENEIDISSSSILGAIYPDEQLVTHIEPMFSTILLTEYDLEPTQAEVDSTLNDIFDTLIAYSTEELPIEYCAETTCSECGNYHADIATCPNIITGTHSSYTCSTCCYHYYTCNSHRTRTCGKSSHSHSESCYSYLKCNEGNMSSPCSESTEHDACNGYHYCGGHRILGITINLDGYYELLAKYFTDPIDVLANKASRTAEEEEKLQTLKDNYELCLNYMEIVLENYGDGLGSSDISGVTFINGSRPNNDALINIAEMQLGNVGGQPFWSWYGFDSRVEWCATFVSWCTNQLGYIDNGTVPKFASCRIGAKWFKDNGQWATGGYSEPVAGDIIFFDWNGDGIANHVGLVVGNDGSTVYTIEGNSGDVCRRRSYSINSSVILGYGLPNY
jgi:hypothetical protein